MFDLANGSAVPLVTYATKPEQLRTNIGWVRAANRAIVTPTASVPLKLRRLKSNGDFEEITEHEILTLLGDPHVALNGKKLRELNHTYLNLTGETFMLMRKSGTPFEMSAGVKALPDAIELLPSHLVQFKLGKERFSDSVIKYAQQEYKIGEVIRGYNPDPENPYYGESIISAAAAAVDSDQQMQSWNRRTFSNNARPGLVFNLQGENIDPAVYDRLKQQMDELYTADGAFKSLVVENGDVKPYMLTHQDLDFLASRAFTRDEILAIFSVSPSMLGMTTDFNRANMDAARYLHILLNVIPRLDDEMAMWNTQLVKKYDPTLELYYESPIPEDVEAKLKEAQAGTNLWRTIDETREEYGLEPLPDDLGAQLVVPINTTTLDRVINAPKPTAGAGDAAGGDDADVQDDTKSEGKKSVPKPRQ
ncbi:phage portal protein [Rathayibacter sp. AY1C5]|uniref:phage portal protein n=1 Tax=Rathayibacter sp. AY1C5 TaxID=2080538 RepID=UPI0015E2D560|nr:phage portal protein [Rathayibacter sp. AY1C5]